ncbi:MAG TPA: hypothetical protein VF529_00060 [Solirubrobacteraceae bacterium]
MTDWTPTQVALELDGEPSSELLTYVEETVGLVDTLSDRRRLFLAAVRIARAAQWNLPKLTAAFESGAFSALDFVRLGEISAAQRLALQLLGNEPLTPTVTAGSASEGSVHLSTPRLQAFVRGDRQALGSMVSIRMQEHLLDCDRCNAAARALRIRRVV